MRIADRAITRAHPRHQQYFGAGGKSFVYRVGLHAGMLAAALGGIDAFVFTGGVGENSAIIRARIAEKLGWLGVTLDPTANAARTGEGRSVVSAALGSLTKRMPACSADVVF